MSKQYWPTGPAESLRTREFAEAEWSRLVSGTARDKPSFLAELKDINDRIIGLKQALPPLNIPQTVSYQEKPKHYGFVVDSSIRHASSSSLNAAKGLRENLARLMAQPPSSQSSQYGSTDASFSRHDTKRTDFDILSSAMRVESDSRDDTRSYHHQDPPLRPVDGYFVPSAERAHENEDARKDAAFAKALEAFRSKALTQAEPSRALPQTEVTAQAVEVAGVTDTASAPLVHTDKADTIEEGEDEWEQEEESGDEEGDESGDEEEEDVEEDVEHHGSASSAPALPPSTAPTAFVSTIAAANPSTELLPTVPPAPIPVPKAENPVPAVHVEAPPPSAKPTEETRREPAAVATKPDATETRDPAVGTIDQLSRLQAWELELQEREQKVLQYMNSLSRPIGAKMAPKQLSDDQDQGQDKFEQRYGDRSRRDESTSALRGSADIHIHNHIAPPMPAFVPAPAPVPPRSSLYDSYQRSTFTPSKYEYGTASAEPTRAYTVPEPRPSVQTRYPQRSEIRSNYAFPPAPYSSLNSGSTNVDLSGLSLERMRELTGHY